MNNKTDKRLIFPFNMIYESSVIDSLIITSGMTVGSRFNFALKPLDAIYSTEYIDLRQA